MSAWFSCFAPKPHASVRLFCFPHAGASAAAFYSWSRDLAESPIELHAAQLPGRGPRIKEPARLSIAELVDGLQRDITPLVDRPFAFFGHSMGAIVAFELARALAAAQTPGLTHLFASGAPAPHTIKVREQLHELSEPEFLRAMVAKYQGIPAEILKHPELLALIMPALRADITAVEAYEYREATLLGCDVTAMAGDADSLVSAAGLHAWRDATRGAFDCQMFPGDHFYLEGARDRLLVAIRSAILRARVS